MPALTRLTRAIGLCFRVVLLRVVLLRVVLLRVVLLRVVLLRVVLLRALPVLALDFRAGPLRADLLVLLRAPARLLVLFAEDEREDDAPLDAVFLDELLRAVLFLPPLATDAEREVVRLAPERLDDLPALPLELLRDDFLVAAMLCSGTRVNDIWTAA